MNCDDVKPGLRIKTTKLGSTEGMLIKQHHLTVRQEGVIGTVKQYVPGHGGDVWFVEHDGSTDVGAYMFTEMEKVMKVWQITWAYPPDGGYDLEDVLSMNRLFTTREKAIEFLQKIAEDDWRANKDDDKEFPGISWDEQYEWRREGRIEDPEFEDARYVAQEVEVQ